MSTTVQRWHVYVQLSPPVPKEGMPVVSLDQLDLPATVRRLVAYNHLPGSLWIWAPPWEAGLLPRGPMVDWHMLPHLTSSQGHLNQLVALLINHHARIVLHVPPEEDDHLFGDAAAVAAHDAATDPHGVGAPRPRLWVLGEQSNPRAISHPLPFGTMPGTRMLWPHVDPRYVRVSNAYPPSAFERQENYPQAQLRLAEEWVRLGRPWVLPIGTQAARLVQRLDLPVVGTLDHVQYVWRFHHYRVNDWTRDLRALVQQAMTLPPATITAEERA